MNRTDQLTKLISDFVFRNRRIADQPSLRISVFEAAADDDTLRCVAISGNQPEKRLGCTLRAGEGIIGSVFSKARLLVNPNMLSPAREFGDTRISSLIACPIIAHTDPKGVLSLESQAKLEFNQSEVSRFQLLSAIIGHEGFQLPQQISRRLGPKRLSLNFRRVLDSVLEEHELTRDDLISLMGGGGEYYRKWLSGHAMAPTRAFAQSCARALGILDAGRSEIIQLVDVTPQLVEILRREPRRLNQLSPEQFELLTADLLDRMGYAVQRIGTSTMRDGGIDIIAVPKIADVTSFLLAVQVKHHRGDRPTGRDAVDRLLSWQNTAFRMGMVVTNTRFTRDAIWAASQDPVRHFLRLRDFDDLTRWLRGIFNSNLDWRELPNTIELAPGISVQVPKPPFSNQEGT